MTKIEFVGSLFRSVLLFTIAKAYSIFRALIRKQQEALDLERLKSAAELKTLEMENAMLRSQLNSHFLFNGLSLIHSRLITEGSPSVELVDRFTALIRYHVSSGSDRGKETLNVDLDHIEQYIDFMQELENKDCNILFMRQVDDISGEVLVPAVLLLSFVENIYKHGSLKMSNQAAIITVKRDGKWLHFHSANDLRSTAPKTPSNNIGIDNIKGRLDNQFRGRYKLTIGKEENRFIVDLKIALWN